MWQFIVGTGHSDGFDWRFVLEAGKTFIDRGSAAWLIGNCRSTI